MIELSFENNIMKFLDLFEEKANFTGMIKYYK